MSDRRPGINTTRVHIVRWVRAELNSGKITTGGSDDLLE